MTLDPRRRAGRTIAAAAAHIEAGASEAASALLSTAEAGPLEDANRGHVEILRGNAAEGWGHMGDAADFFLNAARRIAPTDLRLARDTYVRALSRLTSPVTLPEERPWQRWRRPLEQRQH